MQEKVDITLHHQAFFKRHQESRLLLHRGKKRRHFRKAIQQLAFDISSTQLEQVGRMKGWLFLWGYPEQSPDGRHMWWMTSSTHGHSGAGSADSGPMPGMATPQEIAELRTLSGVEFDVYFLQLMLRHHQGGAPMADYAATHAGQGVVRTLADNMLKSQTGESTYMQQLITERGAAPLPS